MVDEFFFCWFLLLFFPSYFSPIVNSFPTCCRYCFQGTNYLQECSTPRPRFYLCDCSCSLFLPLLQRNEAIGDMFFQIGPSQYASEGMLMEINIEQLMRLLKELENLNWCLVNSFFPVDTFLGIMFVSIFMQLPKLQDSAYVLMLYSTVGLACYLIEGILIHNLQCRMDLMRKKNWRSTNLQGLEEQLCQCIILMRFTFTKCLPFSSYLKVNLKLIRPVDTVK